MIKQQLQSFPVSVRRDIVCPQRSSLYNLEPIGVGTPFVESLTEYVARLAEAHHVDVYTLVTQELLRRAGVTFATDHDYWNVNSFVRKEAHRVNSIGVVAENWICMLQVATLRRDLRSLTMVTWTNVLPPRCNKLLTETRKWCSTCYSAWTDAGERVYDPLIWGLQPVTICPVHLRPLDVLCPRCSRRQPVLAPRSPLGHCARCRTWLGQRRSDPDVREVLLDEEFAKQAWTVEAVGALLAAVPALPNRPDRNTISTSLDACLSSLGQGSVRNFVSCLGISDVMLAKLQRGECLPSFQQVVNIAYRLGVTPLQFLTGSCVFGESLVLDIVPASDPAPQAWQASAGQGDGHHASNAHPQLNAGEAGKAVTSCDEGDVLGSEKQEIVAGRVKAAGNALRAALASDPPLPTLDEIARRAGCSRQTLWKNFPEMCRAIATRRAVPLDKARVCYELEAVLADGTIPISMREVSRRLGVPEKRLRASFRDLCYAISHRYQAYLSAQKTERINRLCAEVRDITVRLHAQGIYPTRYKVGQSMQKPMSLWQAELQEAWRETMQKLGLNENDHQRHSVPATRLPLCKTRGTTMYL